LLLSNYLNLQYSSSSSSSSDSSDSSNSEKGPVPPGKLNITIFTIYRATKNRLIINSGKDMRLTSEYNVVEYAISAKWWKSW
jgi:hypothetical protein